MTDTPTTLTLTSPDGTQHATVTGDPAVLRLLHYLFAISWRELTSAEAAQTWTFQEAAIRDADRWHDQQEQAAAMALKTFQSHVYVWGEPDENAP